MRMPLLLSLLLTFACLWVNDDVSPDAAFSRSIRRHAFRAADVTAMIEPLEWLETDAYSIYVAERDGNRLFDLRVKQPLPDGRMRDIRAAEAVIRQPADEPAWLDMRDVGIRTTSHEAGPAPAAETGRRGESIDEMRAKTWKLPLSVFSDDDSSSTRLDEEGRLRRRTKDLPTWALLRDILSAAEKPPVDRHRRQSSVGLAISLGVAGVFYLFCITGQSLAKHPALHAHWIVCAPMAICLVLGAILISRNN